MTDPKRYFRQKSQNPIDLAKRNMGMIVEPTNPHKTAVHQLRQKVNEINNVSPARMDDKKIFYNKEQFKGRLRRNGIKTPETYLFIERAEDAPKVIERIKELGLQEFVIKPNHLSQGRGIVVLKKRSKRGYEEPDGTLWYLTDIEDKVASLLDTTPSVNKGLLLEERIHTHPDLNRWNPYPETIIDIRTYCLWSVVQFGKMRIPSKASRGLANTGRQGIAMHISDEGVVGDVGFMTNTVDKHPEMGINLKGEKVPFWDKIELTAIRVSKCFHLKFHSADLTIDENGDCVVCEGEAIPWLGSMTAGCCHFFLNQIKKYSGEM